MSFEKGGRDDERKNKGRAEDMPSVLAEPDHPDLLAQSGRGRPAYSEEPSVLIELDLIILPLFPSGTGESYGYVLSLVHDA